MPHYASKTIIQKPKVISYNGCVFVAGAMNIAETQSKSVS